MKVFSSTEASTAGEFLRLAFEMVYDIDPIEQILILRTDSNSGYQLKMKIDGDLFCVVYIYDTDGNQADSIFWQGTKRVENIPLQEFFDELQRIVDDCGNGKGCHPNF